MAKTKKRPDGCLRCGRILKAPSASGMGPTCEKKSGFGKTGITGSMSSNEPAQAEGQVPMFPEVAV